MRGGDRLVPRALAQADLLDLRELLPDPPTPAELLTAALSPEP
jgi:hypothetical protein